MATLIGTLVLLATASASAAGQIDAAAVIECRAPVASYTALAEQATQAAPPAGWMRIEGANPLLVEFRLAQPLAVFGRITSHVAFASSALLAVLDGADAAAVAAPLRIVNQLGGRSRFLGQRIVAESAEDHRELGSRFVTRVALNVSTVDSHPGKVLAGCSYRVDVDDL